MIAEALFRAVDHRRPVMARLAAWPCGPFLSPQVVLTPGFNP